MDETKEKSCGLKRWRKVIFISLAMVIVVGYYLFFFVGRSNLRPVVAQKVYRCAQPKPWQLKHLLNNYGIKTVINLRGDAGKVTEDQQALADELGIKMVSLPLSSTQPPSGELLAELIEAIETAEQPFVLHCHSGTDRAGTASTLAAMAIGDAGYEKAKWQAYVPPGPWKRKCKYNYSHISDILKAYENYCMINKIDTNGWQQFKTWALEVWPSSANDAQNSLSYSYLPQFNKDKRFYPIAELFRQASIPFAIEVVLLALLAVMMYRRSSKNKCSGPDFQEKC